MTDLAATEIPTPRAGRGRTVVLGLDSLDLVLVEKWAAQGLLPFFQKLMSQSPLVRLSTVSRVLQGALWPSLLTGRSPGYHGTYFSPCLVNGTYNLDVVLADHVKVERFYDQLGAHGIRSALVDIPNDLLQRQFNGVQVVDWLTEFQYWRFETYPAEFKREIESLFGTLNSTGGYGPTIDNVSGHRALVGRIEKSLSMKSALTKRLLAQTDFDLICVVFAEPHKAGHHLWKYMDTTHPDHIPTEPYVRDAILSVYQRIDAEFADLASHLNPEDNLIVLSDHGMQACYRGDHFMDAITERLGLSGPARAAKIYKGTAQPSLAGTIKVALRRTLRQALTSLVSPAMVEKLREKFGVASKVDWSQTQAFVLPTDRNSYLRINLRGREPKGIIEPGEEYNALLQRIDKEFRALINGETGKPAVEEVFMVHKLYPGPQVDKLPDVAILWRNDTPINVLESPTIGRLENRVHEDRSGNHRAEGFMLAQGPAFRAGPLQIQGDILQIAPTLLTLQGVPYPNTYEMGPISALFVNSDEDTNIRHVAH